MVDRVLPATPDVDLNRFALSRVVNYLHCGAALDILPEILDGPPRCSRSVSKSELALTAEIPSLKGVIGRYPAANKRTTFKRLRSAVHESREWRKQFHAIGCRGFSYKLDLTMRGYNGQNNKEYALRSDTDIRLALMPHKKLFYPTRVKSYFRRVRWDDNHYFFNEEMPSIAFCIGKSIGDAWYILAMQSDLASRGPAYVREHFRGWRKVLFANVAARAKEQGVTVYLCRAQDVARACFPGTMMPERFPAEWTRIYDLTAAEWGMRLVRKDPVDVQIHRSAEPVLSEYFYELPSAEQSGD